ncbi:MAG: hypothetical protein QXT73_02320 [Candidatus Methanomethylicaceae archaeon]
MKRHSEDVITAPYSRVKALFFAHRREEKYLLTLEFDVDLEGLNYLDEENIRERIEERARDLLQDLPKFILDDWEIIG